MAEPKDSTDWFIENLDKPAFGQAAAFRLGGDQLKKDTFQNWANRDLIKPHTVRGKRLLDGIGLSQLILSQSLIRDLNVSPLTATLMVVSSLVVFRRECVKHPFKSSTAILVFRDTVDEPRVVYPDTFSAIIFRDPKPYIVLPFGRMLGNLAMAARADTEPS